jgi:hypothetical protein
MRNVELIRLEIGKDGTFGVLKIDGKCFCVTLELPWLGNLPDISCILPGEYVCTMVDTSNHGRCFLIKETPGRMGVLFHEGNLQKDTNGCILLGNGFGLIEGHRGILNSRIALLNFIVEMNGEDFNLQIWDM